jgi:xanthine/uracil permease
MISKRAVKSSIPPLVLAAASLVAFVSFRMGQDTFLAVHLPLEIFIYGSSVASAVVMARLLPDRRNPDLRVPLILNGVVLAALVALILLVVIRNYARA